MGRPRSVEGKEEFREQERSTPRDRAAGHLVSLITALVVSFCPRKLDMVALLLNRHGRQSTFFRAGRLPRSGATRTSAVCFEVLLRRILTVGYAAESSVPLRQRYADATNPGSSQVSGTTPTTHDDAIQTARMVQVQSIATVVRQHIGSL